MVDKKGLWLLGLIFVVFVIIFVFDGFSPRLAPGASVSCTETDTIFGGIGSSGLENANGRNYFRAGETCEAFSRQSVRSDSEFLENSRGENCFVDSCVGDNVLEYYCTENGVASVEFECLNGCSNGACNAPACSDGLDNDGDLLFDEEDPGCWEDTLNPNTYDPSDSEEINGLPGGEIPEQGDFNVDGKIDYVDLSLMQLNMREGGFVGDLDADADVDRNDLDLFVEIWDNTVSDIDCDEYSVPNSLGDGCVQVLCPDEGSQEASASGEATTSKVFVNRGGNEIIEVEVIGFGGPYLATVEPWTNTVTVKDLSGNIERTVVLSDPEVGFGDTLRVNLLEEIAARYIVEFKDEPLFKRVVEREKQGSALSAGEKENYKSEILSKQESVKSKYSSNVKSIRSLYKLYNYDVIEIQETGPELHRVIEEIQGYDEVERVVKSPVYYPTLDVSVPHINVDDVWQTQDSSGQDILGEGVVVAIIDSGVDYTHSDFGSCTEDDFLNGACEKVIGGYDFHDDDTDPMDEAGHGTHVASTVAGEDLVYRGVAPGAKLLAYRVCGPIGNEGCFFDSISSAIETAIDPNGDDDFSDHADILQMSLGGPRDQYILNNLTIANSIGALPVIAAGNPGPSYFGVGSPGELGVALTVGATYKSEFDQVIYSVCADQNTETDDLVCFSARGPVFSPPEGGVYSNKPDVVAPGAEVCAAMSNIFYPIDFENPNPNRPDVHLCGTDHVAISGTSMATPHVAGLAALVKQAHPEYTPDQIKRVITQSAKPMDEYNSAEVGHGLVDGLSALNNGFVLTLSQDEFEVQEGISNAALDLNADHLFGSNTGIRINKITYDKITEPGSPSGEIDLGGIESCVVDTQVINLDIDLSDFTENGNYPSKLEYEIFENCDFSSQAEKRTVPLLFYSNFQTLEIEYHRGATVGGISPKLVTANLFCYDIDENGRPFGSIHGAGQGEINPQALGPYYNVIPFSLPWGDIIEHEQWIHIPGITLSRTMNIVTDYSNYDKCHIRIHEALDYSFTNDRYETLRIVEDISPEDTLISIDSTGVVLNQYFEDFKSEISDNERIYIMKLGSDFSVGGLYDVNPRIGGVCDEDSTGIVEYVHPHEDLNIVSHYEAQTFYDDLTFHYSDKNTYLAQGWMGETFSNRKEDSTLFKIYNVPHALWPGEGPLARISVYNQFFFPTIGYQIAPPDYSNPVKPWVRRNNIITFNGMEYIEHYLAYYETSLSSLTGISALLEIEDFLDDSNNVPFYKFFSKGVILDALTYEPEFNSHIGYLKDIDSARSAAIAVPLLNPLLGEGEFGDYEFGEITTTTPQGDIYLSTGLIGFACGGYANPAFGSCSEGDYVISYDYVDELGSDFVGEFCYSYSAGIGILELDSCLLSVSCGDGVINSPVETCDDNNNEEGDGCSETCHNQAGYTCNGEPSVCFKDKDVDSVSDELDLCPETVLGATVDSNGCSEIQVDGDLDGYCENDVTSDLWCSLGNMDNCPFDFNPDQDPLICKELRVFVTSEDYFGDLGGLTGADQKCYEAAYGKDVSLGGIWKAWLSTSTVSAPDRMSQSQGDYKRLDGETVVSDFSEFIQCDIVNCNALMRSISITEKNLNLGQFLYQNVWTGTLTNGVASSDNCFDWTIGGGAVYGEIGGSSATGGGWTQFISGPGLCGSKRHLYCFEQLVPASCGNGVIDHQDEMCDDSNSESGDGCSAACQVEFGYTCNEEPSSCVELDDDNDGVTNANDDCPATSEGLEVDSNGCAEIELDSDLDGVCDEEHASDLWCSLGNMDNCVSVSNPGQEANDNDGLGDACDNCPFVDNLDQADTDEDGLGDVCDVVVCGDFLCEEDEATTCPGDCETNRVFVTSKESIRGNMAEVGGNEVCQVFAENANLGGYWKAWLSDSTESANERLFHSNNRYELLDGTKVADDWNDLVSCTAICLDDEIVITENNLLVADNFPATWTGTDPEGNIDPLNNTCNNWKSSSSSFRGSYGEADKITAAWTQEDDFSCGTSIMRIYCFEQPVEATCGNGIIDAEFEKCDDNNLENGDGCSDACQNEEGFYCEGSPSVCNTARYKVFVSSETYNGNLGGASGGDAACNDLAVNAGLADLDWKAYLTENGVSATKRIGLDSKLDFELMDGTIIAEDIVDLLDGILIAGINLNELNEVVTDGIVWTGTTEEGDPSIHSSDPNARDCFGWTVGDTSARGARGLIGSTNTWANAGWFQCNNEYGLYCIGLEVDNALPGSDNQVTRDSEDQDIGTTNNLEPQEGTGFILRTIRNILDVVFPG